MVIRFGDAFMIVSDLAIPLAMYKGPTAPDGAATSAQAAPSAASASNVPAPLDEAVGKLLEGSDTTLQSPWLAKPVLN